MSEITRLGNVDVLTIENPYLTALTKMSLYLKTLAISTLAVLAANNVNPIIAATPQNQPAVIAKAIAIKNTTVIPGKSVGAINKNTKRSDLVKLFGASKLKDETTRFFGGDAEFPGTVVNLGKDKSITVLWKNANRNQVRGVMIDDSAWKTPEGIGVGTSLSQLQKKIGIFKLSGFGWDYGGIPHLEKTKLSSYKGYLTLRMNPDSKAGEKYPNDVQATSGDGVTLTSNEVRLQRLGVTVGQMIVIFK